MPRVPDDAPELTDKERKQVHEIADAAAKEAQAAAAMNHLPFPSLSEGPRLFATWLASLKDLRNFFGSDIKPSNQSVRVFRISGSHEVDAGTAFGRSFEEFVVSLTRTFCGSRESDEVHELIAITWGLRVPRAQAFIEPRSRLKKQPGQYINPGQRRAKAETPEQVAINAALARGGEAAKKVKKAYNKAYDAAWDAAEADIRANPGRNRRVAAQEAKREKKEEAKEERKSTRRGLFKKKDR